MKQPGNGGTRQKWTIYRGTWSINRRIKDKANPGTQGEK